MEYAPLFITGMVITFLLSLYFGYKKQSKEYDEVYGFAHIWAKSAIISTLWFVFVPCFLIHVALFIVTGKNNNAN